MQLAPSRDDADYPGRLQMAAEQCEADLTREVADQHNDGAASKALRLRHIEVPSLLGDVHQRAAEVAVVRTKLRAHTERYILAGCERTHQPHAIVDLHLAVEDESKVAFAMIGAAVAPKSRLKLYHVHDRCQAEAASGFQRERGDLRGESPVQHRRGAADRPDSEPNGVETVRA